MAETEDESKETGDDYWFKVESKTATEVKVKVWVPVDALVSAYDFAVVVAGSWKVFPADRKLYLIFNPWNEKDEVYMADEKLREEYVLNDSGCVYWSGHKAKPWNFGQFTTAALKCTFKLLESCKKTSMRDTAREVARHMSSVANSCDNNGLLAGNWSQDFSGGRKPWEWTGSAAIFKKYLETNAPVKFGQCWVFSGVTTSMMRCLGIPARSVTNYDSAHDVDGNCTDDKYFDDDYNYMVSFFINSLLIISFECLFSFPGELLISSFYANVFFINRVSFLTNQFTHLFPPYSNLNFNSQKYLYILNILQYIMFSRFFLLIFFFC